MTGELTLSGKVLPVGGIREKVTAARRIKIPELILPEHLREGLTVYFASTYRDVATVLFG